MEDYPETHAVSDPVEIPASRERSASSAHNAASVSSAFSASPSSSSLPGWSDSKRPVSTPADTEGVTGSKRGSKRNSETQGMAQLSVSGDANVEGDDGAGSGERRSRRGRSASASEESDSGRSARGADEAPRTGRGRGARAGSTAQQNDEETKLTAKERKALRKEKAMKKASGKAPPAKMQFDDTKRVRSKNKEASVVRKRAQKELELFAHLPQVEHGETFTQELPLQNCEIHPEIMRVGLMSANGVLCGSNSRTIAMLEAFIEFIRDFEPNENQEFIRVISTKLRPQIDFLVQCRPLAISMGNTIYWFKSLVSAMEVGLPLEQSKEELIASIKRYIESRIVFAESMIAEIACQKIVDGDVVLVFGFSQLVYSVLRQANTKGIRFRVIVVDALPACQGRTLLKHLCRHGIECSYVLLNAVSYVMNEATKVILGAHAMLSNGSAIAHAGNAAVAMMAKEYKRPVMMCCEMFKFSLRVQLDSIVHNELGNPDELVHSADDAIAGWKQAKTLRLVNIKYDLTPPENISMVVAEIGVVPPSSIPVAIREFGKDAAACL